MRHLISIILIWIVILPAIIVVGLVGIKLWALLPTLTCTAVSVFMFTGASVLTVLSWDKYKLSGFKITITSNDVLNIMFLTAGVSAVVALVSGLFNFDSITMPSLCVFAGAGVICFLIMFIEMLIRKD